MRLNDNFVEWTFALNVITIPILDITEITQKDYF